MGKFGLGETNYRGIIPLGFAQSQQLTLANTLHLHKKLRTATWHLQDGLVHNQIDYILLPRCFKSSINKTKTRTYPGANIGSDYGLVPTNLKLKLNMKAMRVSRFKIQNLNITQTRFDLKGGKSSGIDKVAAELLKHGRGKKTYKIHYCSVPKSLETQNNNPNLRTVPEPQNHKAYQPPKQSQAEVHREPHPRYLRN